MNKRCSLKKKLAQDLLHFLQSNPFLETDYNWNKFDGKREKSEEPP
jgi:hypothetical protein